MRTDEPQSAVREIENGSRVAAPAWRIGDFAIDAPRQRGEAASAINRHDPQVARHDEGHVLAIGCEKYLFLRSQAL